MPNLVGMDFNQAHEAYPNLDIQVEATEWSDLEKDKIFSQSIPEGDGVKKGEIVKVKDNAWVPKPLRFLMLKIIITLLPVTF